MREDETKMEEKNYVVSTFYRRPWGRGWINVSHTYGPYTMKDAVKHRKAMLEEARNLKVYPTKNGSILHINAEPLKYGEGSYGFDLND